MINVRSQKFKLSLRAGDSRALIVLLLHNSQFNCILLRTDRREGAVCRVIDDCRLSFHNIENDVLVFDCDSLRGLKV